MDLRYLGFCLTDPVFYDSPHAVDTDTTAWAQTGLPAPDGWYRNVDGPWVYLSPADNRLPEQGWKIHVSVRVSDAAKALAVAWEYCVTHRLAFKFLASSNTLLVRNMKYAERGGSGKFITIYPADEAALEGVLVDLGAALSGLTGPYILSDLRWGDGPLFVRYGGFVRQECRDDRDRSVLALRGPDGRLVPDTRPPFFRVPEWVTLPDFLAPSQTALGDGLPPDGFKYQFANALHFSNGGGVYLASFVTTGEQVVIKEARPYAGLDNHGTDAVTRLAREQEILRQLTGVEGVVELLDGFQLGEHHFMVMRHVDAASLTQHLTRRHPLTHPHVTQESVATYTDWALNVLDNVRDVISSIHERGVTFGDLHPNNVMADEDGRITLIDFEMAYRSNDQPVIGVGAPGFVPPDGRTGPSADLYALACLRLWMFLPLIPLIALDPGKARHLANDVVRRFPVPADFAETIERELRLPNVRSGDLTITPASLGAAILHSASPGRTDRLFPGDIEQFRTNGLGFGHGAAGILYVLARTGHGTHASYEDWLIRAVRAGGSREQAGFYDGLHGISHVLDELGRREDAMDVLDLALRMPDDDLPSNLFSGLAGIGLNLLHFATRYSDPALEARALRIAETLGNRLADKPPARLTDFAQASAETGCGGLLRGHSGIALFFLRMFDHTRDERFLNLAASALAQDLRFCVRVEEDRTIQLDEGWRIMPYLGAGSAGVGIVLHEYLRHRPDEHLRDVLDGIRLAASAEFVIGSGLFAGRAGLIGFLTLCRSADAISRHVDRLSWHAVEYRGNVAFPGDQLLRLSMDLGTGTAGVLLALHAAQQNERLLPFFPTPAQRTREHHDALRPQPAGNGNEVRRRRTHAEHAVGDV